MGRRGVVRALAALSCFVFLGSVRANAQISAADHAAHHPGAGTAPSGATNAPGMGGMMEHMSAPPPREPYPSLMSFPKLSLDERHKIEAQARQRMQDGISLMQKSLDALNTAARASNYAGMQHASGELREGIAQLESSSAALRALSDGKTPSDVALAWFKSEMNLRPKLTAEERRTVFGLSIFHFVTMAILAAFAFAMLIMYFFKMRRATALFGRIDSDDGAPPPGSAPPL